METKVKLLLVDDNPMIVGLLRQVLEGMAEISTANDGADALLKVIDDPPELVVADYQMPGMDGRQLLEKIKSRPATAHTPVILVATRSDINEKLRPLQDIVEDFVEKPFFVREAAGRIKRVVDKIALEKMAKAPGADGMLRGSLAQMTVMDLLQSLDMGRKSCKLTLTRDADRCELYFMDGQIQDARYGPLVGDDAVYRVLTWTNGNFEVDFGGKSLQQTTTRSTQGLLMEGLRMVDEASHQAEEDNVLEV